MVLAGREVWDEVRAQCQTWMPLDPENVEARALWITCLVKRGQGEEARAEFRKIERLRPPNLDKLKTWFAELMK